MKKAFSRCIASMERSQPIQNIKGKSACKHQKQSSKEDVLSVTKPNNVVRKSRYAFDMQYGRKVCVASLPALFQQHQLAKVMFFVGTFPCLYL